MARYITYFEIAALLASLAAWPVLRQSAYWRWFPLLLMLVVGVEFYETFLQPAGQTVNQLVYNIQVPLQQVLYLVILYYAFESKKNKQIVLISIAGLTLFVPVTLILFTAPERFNVLAYCLGSVLIIVFILIRFYEMLQHSVRFDFLRQPFFYVLFAYLLFNVGTLPLFAMSNWLYFMSTNRHMVAILIQGMAILNCILYATYTTTFLWVTVRKAT